MNNSQYENKKLFREGKNTGKIKIHQFQFQFSSVAQLCRTLCSAMDCSKTGLCVHQQLPEFGQYNESKREIALLPNVWSQGWNVVLRIPRKYFRPSRENELAVHFYFSHSICLVSQYFLLYLNFVYRLFLLCFYFISWVYFQFY